MKKIIFLALLAFSLSASAQIATPRFGTTAGRDNTGRVLTYGYSAPAYASTITVVPNAYETIYKVGTLTGNPSVVCTVTKAHVGDKVVFLFLTSGAARTVTFGTGMIASATLVVDSAQNASATFVFNGTKFLEQSRAKE